MTFEKLTTTVFTILLYILSASIYLKNITSKPKRLFCASILCMLLGLMSLLVVFVVGLFTKPLLNINFCTVLISALGSLPAVISMLILNII